MGKMKECHSPGTGRVFILETDKEFADCERAYRDRHPHPRGIMTVPRTDGVTSDGRRGRGWYFDADMAEKARSVTMKQHGKQ